MFTQEVSGINQLLVSGCEAVKQHGQEVRTRGTVSREIRPCLFQINDPTDRTLLFPGRGNSNFQTILETLWVLGAKDNRIHDLRIFLPRADEYSDNPNLDHSRWRAGYPERIRNYGCTYAVELGERATGITEWTSTKAHHNGTDQLKYVYDTLALDTDSRQAIINIWDARLDDYKDINQEDLLRTKDRPCTQSVMFCIRKGELDCVVTMRSNDVIFGLSSINMYEFTVMQEILAKLLNVKMGKYFHFTNSLHVYDHKYEKMDTIIENYYKYTSLINLFKNKTKYPRFDWSKFVCDNYNKTMHKFETIYNYDVKPENLRKIVDFMALDNSSWDNIPETFNSIFQHYCIVYLCCIDGRISFDKTMEVFKYIENSDLKLACMYWVLKHYKQPDTALLSVLEGWYDKYTCIA